MTKSLSDIIDQIRSTLAVTDPDLDTSAGSVTRKIIDAVGESIAESYLDQHMLSYTYDIDSKMEGDLDSFCQAVGGISRLAAKRATGSVTFTRSGTVSSTVVVPVNTQINSSASTVVSVVTVTSGTLLPGQTSLTLPVQAVIAGPEGNVAADALTILATAVEGVTAVTNLAPLTGGLAQETDSELRERWKRTVFRSMAGTEAMYLATALDDPNVTAANVLGSSKRRREQVQVATGVAATVVDDLAFAFPTGVFVGANIDGGTLMIKDVDYTWDTSVNPPQVVIDPSVSTYDTGEKDGSGNPVLAPIEGAILDVDFEYTPQASRNDPTGSRFGGSSIINRVDVWCAGKRAVAAQQSVVFSSAKRFSAVSTDPYPLAQFVRLDDTHPTNNNIFVPLAFGPILSVPDVLSIGGSTYGRVGAPTAGVTYPNAYRIVHRDDAFGYTATSLFGLEWDPANIPANGTVFTIGGNGTYTFNEVPRSVQAQVDRWRLVGVDAKAHAAKEVTLRFNLAVMYDRGANQDVVNEAIDLAISKHLGKVGLGGVVQASDIENAVHNVSGVDNVRFQVLSDHPGATYATRNTYDLGIQRVVTGTVTDTYISTSGWPIDIVYGDSETPAFESTRIAVKAQNTFKAT